MNSGICRLARIAALIVALASLGAAADVKGLIKDLFPIPSATGNEQFLAAKIAGFLPKTAALSADNLGGVYLKLGAAASGPAILAGLDEFGYVVSGFTPSGYLRLDRATPLPSTVYDSFLLGHPVVIMTKTNPAYGVVSQPAMHLLTRERRDQLAKDLTLDLIFVDLGVRTEAEARAKGIEILDPVTFWPDLTPLANEQWSGPALGQKAVCAALVAAARELAKDKTSAADLAWPAQSRFPARGTRASLGMTRAKAKLGAKTAIVLDIVAADRGPNSPLLGKGIVVAQAKEAPSKVREAVEAAALEKKIPLQYRTGAESPLLAPFVVDGGDALILGLPVRYAGTPSEIVALKDVQALADLVMEIVKEGRLK
jgi:putative aminopeptidase FrvX